MIHHPDPDPRAMPPWCDPDLVEPVPRDELYHRSHVYLWDEDSGYEYLVRGRG